MKTRGIIRIACAMLAAIASAAGPASATGKAGDVVSVRGKAVIERTTGKEDARIAAVLQESDNVMTRDKARVKMLFRDDSVLTLGGNSRLIIKKYLESPESRRAESLFELVDGRLRAVVGGAGFKVTTPTAFAAARGTIFTIVYNAETRTTEIEVLEGSVEVRNINADVVGSQVVGAGQSTSVIGNKPPTPPSRAKRKASTRDDDAGLPLLEGPRGRARLFSDLRGLVANNSLLNSPIEQEPHAATGVGVGALFPR